MKKILLVGSGELGKEFVRQRPKHGQDRKRRASQLGLRLRSSRQNQCSRDI